MYSPLLPCRRTLTHEMNEFSNAGTWDAEMSFLIQATEKALARHARKFWHLQLPLVPH